MWSRKEERMARLMVAGFATVLLSVVSMRLFLPDVFDAVFHL